MAWITAAAIGGSALVGAGVGLYSANKAADQQTQANQQALAVQQQTLAQNQQFFNQGQANIKPYLGAGQEALGRLGESYANPGSITSNPDYQFGVREGTNALQNSAAARGGLMGGNFARGITQFGQDYGTNYLSRYRSGLLDIGRMGAGAATGSGSLFGQQASNNTQGAGMIGSSYQGIGQAQASGTVGGFNALSGSLSSGANNYMLYNALNRSSYNNGFTGGGSV